MFDSGGVCYKEYAYEYVYIYKNYIYIYICMDGWSESGSPSSDKPGLLEDDGLLVFHRGHAEVWRRPRHYGSANP